MQAMCAVRERDGVRDRAHWQAMPILKALRIKRKLAGLRCPTSWKEGHGGGEGATEGVALTSFLRSLAEGEGTSSLSGILLIGVGVVATWKRSNRFTE